ncbi:hypothetical protein [Lachnoanaerobaculum umeaense]|uniref:Uncharacterized protein n=1 Tax=Lachnoanaerobaculum umeaense TaxID=617123 RepID=A0A385PXE9_9FIRM|nr:hypothetical protein [Lachnoanaerobaculum umeaense]AYA98770.1 hypothetical protein D4A81_01790 [Lachnoanaerobaculum umeaense]PZX00017.1 hypothetical protein C7439_101113 [Lachnoanaerobaculum umeaense]
MNRVDVVIKDSLFKKVDLEVDRCAAYRDDVEDRIYIYMDQLFAQENGMMNITLGLKQTYVTKMVIL